MKHIVRAVCYDKHGYPLAYSNNNYLKSHPLQAYFARKVGHPERIYLHAEIAVILACGTHNIHSMVITRQKSNNQLALAKPCVICQEAIKAFRIKHVYYSTNEGTMEKLKWQDDGKG